MNDATSRNSTNTLTLPYQKPFGFDQLLNFFRVRALEGVECVDEDSYVRIVRLLPDNTTGVVGWICVINKPKNSVLEVKLSDSLLPWTNVIAERLRIQFDLNCNPETIASHLANLDEVIPGSLVPGTRLPGCFNGFETCARAILGQQVTLAVANKLAAKIVQAYGLPIETPFKYLTHAFPTAEEILSIEDIENAFGSLGVIKTRSAAIREIAKLVIEGRIVFDGSIPAEEQIELLLSIKGIGPWSAGYIAMRTMAYADAFLETDAGIKHALPDLTPKERLALAEQWRPYRSYANINLWNAV